MQAYIRLFIHLLMPLTLLLSLLSIGYFSFNYDFSKAIKLGILAGVLLGISLSLVLALFLLIFRSVQKEKSPIVTYVEESDHAPTNTAKSGKESLETGTLSKEIKSMLLLDKELTFDIILQHLNQHKEYVLKSSDPKEGKLSFETKEGSIQTSITSLTQHTSQIILQAQNNVKTVRNLISQLKEKESSFLQY